MQNKAVYYVVTEIKHYILYVFVHACVGDEFERKDPALLMW